MPAIGRHKTSTADGSWDGPGNVARLRNDESASYYRKMFAWVDPDGDPTTKAAYKFPNHFVDGDGNIGAASIKGCQAGIAVLNGAMGGAKVPSADRQGIYNHLAGHLRDADVEPAELKSQPLEVMDMERRYIPVEMRVDPDGSIEGYAAVFNQWADLGFFREKVRAGAFKKTIKEADIRALFNHDANYVLGRNKAKTLHLAEDDHGLQFRVDPPDTSFANDLAVSIKRKDINQASFGFRTVRDEWNHDADPAERELIEVRLFDVSVVTYPAYEQTEVTARSLADQFIARVQHNMDFDEIDHMLDQLRSFVNLSMPEQEPHMDGDQEPEGQETKTLVGLKRRLVEIEQLRDI